MKLLVRPLRRSEIRRTSRLLADAFAVDPFIGHFFGDPYRRRLAFPPFFRVVHDLADAGGLFAVETGSALAGVAAWAPP